MLTNSQPYPASRDDRVVVAVAVIVVAVGGVEYAVVAQLVEDGREHPVVQLEDRVGLAVHDPAGQRSLVAAHFALEV